MKNRYLFIPAGVVVITLLITGSLCDLEIAQALFHANNGFSRFLAGFPTFPIGIVLGFILGTLLKMVVNKEYKKNIMKKIILTFALACTFAFNASAQKFALVDMEYILKNIPAYERANEQLNQTSKKWQAEVDAINTEVQTLYKNYQNESVFLSQEQKKKKQDEIMAKEKEAGELKRKYFGPEGELYKKRESLMSPIQEEIYTAVKEIANLRGYSLILDRAADSGIIFASPKNDISNEVLAKMGYSVQ
mgnify:CR=1 FL=1